MQEERGGGAAGVAGEEEAHGELAGAPPIAVREADNLHNASIVMGLGDGRRQTKDCRRTLEGLQFRIGRGRTSCKLLVKTTVMHSNGLDSKALDRQSSNLAMSPKRN